MSIFSQCFPPRPKWTARDIPSLAGRVCVVTGGNSGIGKETVKVRLSLHILFLLFSASTLHPSPSLPCPSIDSLTRAQALITHSATVYILARSPAKAAAAIADLKASTGKEARFIECDLARLASVRSAAEELTL